jgi:ASC-1-like (ASCH) protein
MIHHMRLHESSFGKIVNGTKKIEVRLHDEKRQAMNVGDVLIFENRTDGSKVEATVAELIPAPRFKDIFDDRGHTDIGHESTRAGLESLYEHYTAEDEESLGVLAIVLSDIRRS